jgi:hypothetical protein
LKIPDDISIVTFGESMFFTVLVPSLTLMQAEESRLLIWQRKPGEADRKRRSASGGYCGAAEVFIGRLHGPARPLSKSRRARH